MGTGDAALQGRWLAVGLGLAGWLWAPVVCQGATAAAASAAAPAAGFAIDRAAPVVTEHTVEIEAPIAEVWRVLTDVDAWHQWNPGIVESAAVTALGPGAAFSFKSEVAVKAEVTLWQPPNELGWRARTFGAESKSIWHLESIGPNATRVHTEESLRGLAATLMQWKLQPALADGLASWQEHLKSVCEANN